VPAARATKPDQSEFLPYYARYTDLVGEGDVVATLAAQMKETQALLHGLPPAMATHSYAPGKWTVNQMIGHVIDAERIFTGRALRFARSDSQPLPGFEQDPYVNNANFNAYPLAELAAELDAVRQATIFLFSHLDEAAWMRRGVASGAEVSVRALAYITAGHELHHRQLLKTKYVR
jgi:DinB family protein